MNLSRSWLIAVALILGCTRDLEVPEQAPVGGLFGRVDTAGHIDPGGLPVGVVDQTGFRQTVTTEADGTFRAGNLRPGSYALELKLSGFAPLVVPFLQVRPGSELDAGVLAPGWLSGTTKAAGIVGKVGADVPADITGSTVTASLVQGAKKDVVALQTVARDGKFVLGNLPPGTYELVASNAEFQDSPVKTVVLEEGKTADLSADPLVLHVVKGTVSGTVKREVDGNAPVNAVGATVSFGGSATTATVDGQGQFSADLSPGTYRVTATITPASTGAGTYADPETTRTVTVHGGKSHTLPGWTLTLVRGVITGTVELSDRAPIDQLAVSVAGTGFSAQVTPDALAPYQGPFTITGVPYGPCDVVAAKQRYSRASSSVTVGATPVNAGTLKLALQQGDFGIDDGDPTSEPGYTRKLPVTLDFTGFPKTGVTSYRAGESSDLSDAGWLSYSGTKQPFPLSDAEGSHTVYAQYQDSNNSISPTFQQTIVVDRLPPSKPSVTFLDTGEVGQGATLLKFTSLTQNVPMTVTGNDTTGGAGVSKMQVATALLADGGIDPATGRDSFVTSTSLKNQNGNLPFPDGPVTAYVQLIDLAGNVGPIGSDAIVIDHTAPTNGSITIADGPKASLPGTTNVLQVEVTPTIAAEPNSGLLQIKYANASGAELDGAPYGTVRSHTPWNLAFGLDAKRTVFAVFRDAAGNTSSPVTADITLDTTVPAPSEVSASVSSPSPTNSSVIQVAVSASAAAGITTATGLTVSEDYGFSAPGTLGPMAMPGSGTVTFTVSPGEGARPFFVRFRDGAGNDAIVPLSVMVDTTRPTGTIALYGSLADGTLSTSISAQGTIGVQANITGASGYFIGDSTLTACPTAAASYTAIPASGVFPATPPPSGGNLVVRACFRDDAGNLFGGPVAAGVSPLLWAPAASIGYKATPPTGCTLAVTGLMADGISAAPALLSAKPTVSFVISGCVGATEMVMANGPMNCNSLPASTAWQPFNGSGTFNVPAGDGPKQLSVCVRDIARNPAALTPMTITLDTTPPAQSSVSATVTTASPTNSTLVQLNVTSTASDLSPTAALTISEDYGFSAAGTIGPMAMPGSPALSFTIAAGDGARTFYARFRDRVGNDTIVPMSITMDTASPTGTVALLGALADGTPSSALTATAAVTVHASVSGAVSYFLGDGALATCPPAGSFTALPSTGLIPATLTPASGALTVRACFRDAAGNVLGGPVGAGVSPLLWVPAVTIPFDATPPSGCTLAVAGTNVDGSPAPAGKTAALGAGYTIGACAGAAELVVAAGVVNCASLPSTTNWQPFVTAGVVPLPIGDGLKTVSACARDGARNVSAMAPATIALDTTAPAVSAVSATLSSPSPTNALALTLAVSSTATDLSPTAALTVSEDLTFAAAGTVGPMGMPGGGSVGYTLSSGDGVRTVYARFRDAVGNDTVVPVSVTIDSAPPSGTISLVGSLLDGTPSASVSAVTAIKVQSNITGAVSYFLGDQTLAGCPAAAASYTALPANGVLPVTVTPAAGTLTVRACFRDVAGNIFGGPVAASASALLWSPAAALPFDNVPPAGCALALTGLRSDKSGPAPAGLTGTTDITFGLSSCTGSPTELAIASGSLTCSALPPTTNWQPFITSGSFAVPLGDGLKPVSVCVRDAARNAVAVGPVNITLDTQAPLAGQVTATLSSANPTNTLTLTIAVSSSAVDLAALPLMLSQDQSFRDSTTVGPLAMPGGGTTLFTLTAGPDDTRAVYVRFSDSVGNAIAVPVTVQVDTAPPSGSFFIEGVLGDGTASTDWAQSPSVTIHADGITGGATSYFFTSDAGMASCAAIAPAAFAPMPGNGLISTVLGSGLAPDGGLQLVARGCFRDAAGNLLGGPDSSALRWNPSDAINYDPAAPTGCSLTLAGFKVDGTPVYSGKTARLDVKATINTCFGAAEMAIATSAISCTSAQVAWEPFTVSKYVTLPAGDGVDTVQLCVRNNAKAVASPPAVPITLDTTPPVNSWTLVESGDGWVNKADYLGRGGSYLARIDATFSGAYQLVVEYSAALGLPVQRVVLGGSPAVLYVPLSPTVNPGLQQFDTYFEDDVGNQTPRVPNTVGLDTVAPLAPVLSTVSAANRSATLFWLPVLGDSSVAGYGMLSAAAGSSLPVPPSANTVVGNVGQGVVPGLVNRTEYQFAVYTVDAAGNLSPASNVLTAVTGFQQKKVPIVSTYPLQPLDIAVKGEEIFLTYSEQTVGWGTVNGNVKLAHSTDLGDTWTFTTIDPEFGFNRAIARLSRDDSATYITTVGTDLFNSDAGISNPSIGALKVYTSNDGVTWGSPTIDNTTTPLDFSDTTSAGLATIGTGARAYSPRGPGTSNQVWSKSLSWSLVFILPCGFWPWGACPPPPPPYYDFTDGVPFKDLKTCTGNEAEIHAWRSNQNIVTLSQRFAAYPQLALDPNGDGDAWVVAAAGAPVDALDLACSALPDRTNGYLLWRQSTGAGSVGTLAFRRRVGVTSVFAQPWLSTGATMPVDVDPGTTPKLYASGTSVHVVYRNVAGELKLGSSVDEGTTFTWTRLSTDPSLGHTPVIAGDGHADLAIASISADQSSVTLLVPSMRNVHGSGSAGVGTASLDWDSVGTAQYRLDRNDGGVAPFPDTVFTAQAHFTVPSTPGQALYHRLSGTDALGQGTDEGQVWQVAPFTRTPLYTPSAACSAVNASAAVIAHDAKVLAMGPLGCRKASDTDFTMYRSTNSGATMTPFTPSTPSLNAVSTRAIAGANGRAVLAYKQTGVAGLKVMTFPDITGAPNAELNVDNTATAEYISVVADRVVYPSYHFIAATNVGADTISIVWCDAASGSCGLEGRLSIPLPATSTLYGAEIVRVDGSNMVLVWRVYNSTQSPPNQVWYAVSNSWGSTFTVIPPTLLANGTSYLPPDSASVDRFDAHVRGAGNGATTFVAHPGTIVPPGQGSGFSLGLFLHVTGIAPPLYGDQWSTFQIDGEPMKADVVDAQTSPSGNYILYETWSVVLPEDHLKLAYCRTDCHLQSQWTHSTITTMPSGSTKLGPALGLSTLSAGNEERIYGLYYDGTAVQLLSGGALRRTR